MQTSWESKKKKKLIFSLNFGKIFIFMRYLALFMFSQRSDTTPPLPIYTRFVEVGAFEMHVSVRHPMRRELGMEGVGLI